MPSRALLTESQTIPAADITQALANIGIARASLSAPVTRTSTTTVSNTGLSALNVALLPSSRYRIIYKFLATYATSCGMKVALFFPSTANFDLYLRRYDTVNNGIVEMVPDVLNSFGSSGTVFYDTGPGSDAFAGIEMEVLITTTSLSTTYGDFYVGISQSTSDVNPLTISPNSYVEVLKF